MVRLGLNGQRLDLVAPVDPGGALLATVRGEGMEATASAYPGHRGFRYLIDFFADLERHWRGWKGTRRWESQEHELSMTARHTGSRVLLDVRLSRQRLDEHDWDLRFSVTLDAGEELSNAAAGIRLEFASPGERDRTPGVVPPSEEVTAASQAYEQAERTYLDLVRQHPSAELAEAAARVAASADHWQGLAWARVHALNDMEAPDELEIHNARLDADAAELLMSSWLDVATVHRGVRLPQFDRTGPMVDPGDSDDSDTDRTPGR